jgi:hypothetical protein
MYKQIQYESNNGELTMRIHDIERDKTLSNIVLYLTSSEAAELVGFLYDMLRKPNVTHGVVHDREFEHGLEVYLYNQYEYSGFNRRQKIVLEDDA